MQAQLERMEDDAQRTQERNATLANADTQRVQRVNAELARAQETIARRDGDIKILQKEAQNLESSLQITEEEKRQWESGYKKLELEIRKWEGENKNSSTHAQGLREKLDAETASRSQFEKKSRYFSSPAMLFLYLQPLTGIIGNLKMILSNWMLQ